MIKIDKKSLKIEATCSYFKIKHKSRTKYSPSKSFFKFSSRGKINFINSIT